MFFLVRTLHIGRDKFVIAMCINVLRQTGFSLNLLINFIVNIICLALIITNSYCWGGRGGGGWAL